LRKKEIGDSLAQLPPERAPPQINLFDPLNNKGKKGKLQSARGEASAFENASFLPSRSTPICGWGLDTIKDRG